MRTSPGSTIYCSVSFHSSTVCPLLLTMLTPRTDLSVAILAYYVPSLILSVYVCWRQEFGRQLGWIYLAILGIVRMVGSAINICTISNPDASLTDTAAVLQSVGLSSLLLAMLGTL